MGQISQNRYFENKKTNVPPVFYPTGESVDNSSTKYFQHNRENYVIANRWKERKLTDEYRKMYEIEMKPSISAKLSAATDTGYTGLSLLYIPYKLYEFNYITDTTRDIMHLVALNLCKKLLKRIFETYITGASQDEFNEKMQNFPLTPGELNLFKPSFLILNPR